MKNKKITRILTAQNTMDRLTVKKDYSFEKYTETLLPTLELNRNKKYQKILGFGGAFTEAASYTLSQISPKNRLEVINAYFHPENGLGYTIGRVHIHSCDFALENYTYVDKNDISLESFDISRDHKWVIPLIKDAEQVANEKIKLLASPWSPPAWMKSNNEMNNGGKLLEEYFDTWALYYTKFINAYQKENMSIWGITVQNEPAAIQVWDSCIYSGEEERDFIKNHLGPTMHREGLEDINILIWDHNRDIVVERASTILSDPEAARYVWGTGIHWYVSEAFDKVGKVHELYPEKHILFTEGCQEGGVKLGEWFTGERYGRNIIGDLNHWVKGYLDWNLVLNENGGPNHVNNLCDAPIIVDTVNDRLHYNSSYYYIGHFSKYIQPNAQRIDFNLSTDVLCVTVFENPDGSTVVVIMNETDEKRQLYIKDEGYGTIISSPEHSIQTLLF